MSYINRLVGDGALYAVTYNGAIKNYVNSVTPTLTGCRVVDPLTSTSGGAILVPDSATNSLSIPSPFLISSTSRAFTIETVFHITPVSSDTVLAAFSGAAGTFLTAQSNSRLNINLPFSGYAARDITVTCFYDQAHHLVVSVSPNLVNVYLDGRQMASFAPSDMWVLSSTQGYHELGNLVFANTSTPFTIDCVAFYRGILSERLVKKHYLAAFLSPDPKTAVSLKFTSSEDTRGSRVWSIVGEQQDYAYRMHSPVTTGWDEWTTDNTKSANGTIGINIRTPPGYEQPINAYSIDNIGKIIHGNRGTIHFSLNSYSTSTHASRGLFYLSSNKGYEYEMRMSAAHVPTFTIYTPVYDGSNVFTGYTSQDYTLTTATNGQPLKVGIVWTASAIKVIFNDSVQHTITHTIKAPRYKLYIGTGRTSVIDQTTTQSILSGGGVYNIRIRDSGPDLKSSDIERTYGQYMFSSDAASKYKNPIYADASASIDLPLGRGNSMFSSSRILSYNMQRFIDGPAGLVTEMIT